MKKESYNLIENLEDYHWWHRARREIIIDTIINNITDYGEKRLLDIGCGSGYFLSKISQYIPNSMGIESYEYSNKKYNNIKKCDIFNNDLEDCNFNIITALDVIEHIENENQFLHEVKRLLCNFNGGILITVPAYQWLFTYHDVINEHYRRYSLKRLKNLLLDNGFEIEKISYFNFFLFPPFMIVRFIHKIFNIKKVETDKIGIFNNILYKIFNLEKYILRKMNFPFGSSIMAFCKLKGTIENEKS